MSSFFNMLSAPFTGLTTTLTKVASAVAETTKSFIDTSVEGINNITGLASSTIFNSVKVFQDVISGQSPETVQKSLANLNNCITTGIKDIAGSGAELAEIVGHGVGHVVETIGDGAVDTTSEIMHGISDPVKNIPVLGNIVKFATDSVVKEVQLIADDTSHLVDNLADSIAHTTGVVIKATGSVAAGLGKLAVDAGAIVANPVSETLEVGQMIFSGKSIFTIADNITDIGQSAVRGVAKLTYDATQLVQDTGMNIEHVIHDVDMTLVKAVGTLPGILTIGDIPVISTVGNAIKTATDGLLSAWPVAFIDNAVMLGLQVVQLGTVTIRAGAGITGRLADDPLDIIGALVGNNRGLTSTSDMPINSVSEAVESILVFNTNMIKSHWDHNVLFFGRAVFDVAHKIVTEAAEDFFLAPIVNPIADAIYQPIGFLYDDVFLGGLIEGTTSAEKALIKLFFGEVSNEGVMNHSYLVEKSTAAPTIGDKILTNLFSGILDKIFHNDGSEAGSEYKFSRNDTTDPTFIEGIWNRISVAIPNTYTEPPAMPMM